MNIPIGSVVLWGGKGWDIPDGWRPCDGSIVSSYRDGTIGDVVPDDCIGRSRIPNPSDKKLDGCIWIIRVGGEDD